MIHDTQNLRKFMKKNADNQLKIVKEGSANGHKRIRSMINNNPSFNLEDIVKSQMLKRNIPSTLQNATGLNNNASVSSINQITSLHKQDNYQSTNLTRFRNTNSKPSIKLN